VGVGDGGGHGSLTHPDLASEDLGAATLDRRGALVRGDPRAAHLVEPVDGGRGHTSSLRRLKGCLVH